MQQDIIQRASEREKDRYSEEIAEEVDHINYLQPFTMDFSHNFSFRFVEIQKKKQMH